MVLASEQHHNDREFPEGRDLPNDLSSQHLKQSSIEETSVNVAK